MVLKTDLIDIISVGSKWIEIQKLLGSYYNKYLNKESARDNKSLPEAIPVNGIQSLKEKDMHRKSMNKLKSAKVAFVSEIVKSQREFGIE